MRCRFARIVISGGFPVGKTCLTTVIDEAYEDYLPLFLYCAMKAYPDYEVRIFRRGQTPFEGFPEYPYNTIALRFVVPKEYYHGMDWVYVTDIDMMIMPEPVALHGFHLNEMHETGLCYSNSLRNKHHYAGCQSLTGLHFADMQWFEWTETQRMFYYGVLKNGVVGTYREYDGVMLYRMADKSRVGLPGKYKLYKRHHGIHLGSFRLYKNDPKREEKLYQRITRDYARKWLKYYTDPNFKKLIEQANENPTIRQQLAELYNVCRVVK